MPVGVEPHEARGDADACVGERDGARAVVHHVPRRDPLPAAHVEGRPVAAGRRDLDRAGHNAGNGIGPAADRARRRGRGPRRGRCGGPGSRSGARAGGARDGERDVAVAIAPVRGGLVRGRCSPAQRNRAQRAPATAAGACGNVEAAGVALTLPDAHVHARERDVAVAVAAPLVVHGQRKRAQRAPATALGPRADVERLRVTDTLPDAHLDARAPPPLVWASTVAALVASAMATMAAMMRRTGRYLLSGNCSTARSTARRTPFGDPWRRRSARLSQKAPVG